MDDAKKQEVSLLTVDPALPLHRQDVSFAQLAVKMARLIQTGQRNTAEICKIIDQSYSDDRAIFLSYLPDTVGDTDIVEKV